MKNAELVRQALAETANEASARGMPRFEPSGQLIRPLLAYSVAMHSGEEIGPAFWKGALAIQLAHEASLVHDDIVDEAKLRRGEPTVAHERGTAKALVYGDHLLTASYRLAAETGSLDFVTLFSRSVERTVAGEIAQARALDRALTFPEYQSIAASKSGELLGASLALSAALHDQSRIETRASLGRQLGLLYQMLDDLLDYCPSTDTGKAALGDFSQRRWTWPLFELETLSFDEPCDDVLRRFHTQAGDCTPVRRCVARIEREAIELKSQLTEEFRGRDVGQSLVDGWVKRARAAVANEETKRSTSITSLAVRPGQMLRSRLPASDDVVNYLARNSRSFRFASRFFPHSELERVAHVYSFCRVTDDLVDQSEQHLGEELLDEWMCLAQVAYEGKAVGIPFLERTMREMSSANVPFVYAAELGAGMRMDLRGERYETLNDLRTYTYRVASVVGLWLTELSGVRGRATLQHAEALGHAMQLTNILRDVGEDARNGRLYLPADSMRAHGVSKEDIAITAKFGGPLPERFPALMQSLIDVAEAEYAFALGGVRDLPQSFQKPVAVAAYVYRGIHEEIRNNRYDTLSQRAVTSGTTKAMLAARAIWSLQLKPTGLLQSA